MTRHTAAFLMFITVALTGAAASAGPSFNISTILDDGMFNNAPSIAVDSAGVIHVAYTAQFDTDSSTKEVWYARRAPGGSWEFTQITNNSVREEFACLELDDDENVHIAFHTGVASGGNRVRYVNNVGNKDGSFNTIQNITGEGFVIAEIAIDSTDTVHFVFRTQNFSGAPEEVYYTTWSQAGGNGPLINLSQSAAEEDYGPQIAVDPDDHVHVVWQRGNALGGPLKYVNNVSGSFQEVATGVGSVLESFIVIDDAGKVTIVYRPGFDAMNYIESSGRGGFTSPQPVYTGEYRSAFMERIAVDTNGHRYAAFASNIAANRGMFLSQEVDAGWLQPQFIDNDPEATNLQLSLDINSDGNLAIVYCMSDVVGGNVIARLFVAETTIDLGGCPTDLAGNDGVTDVFDLFELLNNWGTSGPGADLAAPNDTVDVFDLFVLLGAWGACE